MRRRWRHEEREGEETEGGREGRENGMERSEKVFRRRLMFIYLYGFELSKISMSLSKFFFMEAVSILTITEVLRTFD